MRFCGAQKRSEILFFLFCAFMPILRISRLFLDCPYFGILSEFENLRNLEILRFLKVSNILKVSEYLETYRVYTVHCISQT